MRLAKLTVEIDTLKLLCKHLSASNKSLDADLKAKLQECEELAAKLEK